MKEFENLYVEYKLEKKDKEETCKKLIELIFLKKRELGLSTIDEDNFQDFLIYEMKKLPKVLDSYKENCGKFSSYIYGSLQMAYFYWTKKKKRTYETQNFVSYCGQEYYESQHLNYKEYEKETEEKLISKEEEDIYSKRFLERQKLKKEEKFLNEALIILCLKSCYYIESETIKKIANFTGTEQKQLETWIDEAKQEITKRKKNMEQIQQRRDNAYYYKNKYLLHKNSLGTSNEWYELINKKFIKQSNRWNLTVKHMMKKNKYLSPTNISIGKILNKNERHIAYVLKKININMDSYELKCYPFHYENLSSNQQQ